MATHEIPTPKSLKNSHPGNSYTERSSNKNKSAEFSTGDQSVDKRPKAKQVATVKKVQKHSMFKKLCSSIIDDSIETVKERAFAEIIVPGIKSLLFDSAVGMLDGMLFGNSGFNGYSRPLYQGQAPRQEHTSYGAYYNQAKMPPQRASRQNYGYGGYSLEPDDIIVATRNEANRALNEVSNYIRQYGHASIAVLYDSVGLSSDWTDNQYGWTSLQGARIKQVPGGFLIIMPPTHELD